MDIDKLKANNTSIFHAGPGIAGVSTVPYEAYHFYTAEAPRLINDLHSHMRSYTSTIIQGEVRNHIYEIQGEDRTSELMLVNTSCELLCGVGGCAKHEVVQRNLNVVKVNEISTKQGETYALKYDVFHKFELVSDGPVITHLRQQQTSQFNTQIIVDSSYLTNKCCPPDPSEDVLWQMVRSTLEQEEKNPL